MSTVNQRQAVYVATMNVLAEHEIPFDDGQAGGAEKVVTKDMRASIVDGISLAILNGEVEMSTEGKAKYNDLKKMKTYVSGLVSNWFRKDPRLNGNTKHQAKNPGSRAGAGDEQIKALKTLLTVKAGDAEAVAAIEQAIEARKTEISASKQVELTPAMIECLPAELKTKLGL